MNNIIWLVGAAVIVLCSFHPRILGTPVIRACPLYPQKRTCAVQLGMSALGQMTCSRRLFAPR
jgi:hypothetical protein